MFKIAMTHYFNTKNILFLKKIKYIEPNTDKIITSKRSASNTHQLLIKHVKNQILKKILKRTSFFVIVRKKIQI